MDCGGPCSGCASDLACGHADDCASGVCRGGRCVAGSCFDGVRNGDEVDVDCGGPCGACRTGLRCSRAADCASEVCTASRCTAPACDDDVTNGDETDTDCGGSCSPCALGAACGDGRDCSSYACSGGRCVAADSCAALAASGVTVDGVYWIASDGTEPAERWCNQTIRGGGWTLLSVIRPDATQIVGTSVCTTHSASTTCAGRLPPTRVSASTELLIVDASTGDWIVLSGFSASGALARLAGAPLPTSASCASGCDAVLDPELHVVATSGAALAHERPLRQWWRFGGWWMGGGAQAGNPCGAVLGLGYVGVHGQWSRSDASACGVRAASGAQEIYWR